MKTDRNTSTTGTLSIRNANGLSVGVSDTVYLNVKVDTGLITVLETQRSDRDFAIRTRRGNTFDNAIYIDSSTQRIGMFNSAPSTTLDVTGDGRFTGDLEVEGSLTVTGDTTYLDVTSLRVQDKTIELALTSDSTLLTDAEVDGAGIIIKATGNDKSLLWEFETGSWTSTEDFDLVSGKSYKIDNVTKLSANRIDDSVLYAEGLIRIGTLQALQVDNINLDGSTISSSDPLFITSNGIITVNSQRITGVLDPQISVDVANKNYVDTQISSQPVLLSFDTTGLSNPSADFALDGPYTDVITLLNAVVPAASKTDGTVANIIATSYSNTTVTGIDVSTGVDKSFVSVYVDPDDSTTPQLESVLQDVAFSPVDGEANLVPDRAFMEFIVNGAAWQWVRTTEL